MLHENDTTRAPQNSRILTPISLANPADNPMPKFTFVDGKELSWVDDGKARWDATSAGDSLRVCGWGVYLVAVVVGLSWL